MTVDPRDPLGFKLLDERDRERLTSEQKAAFEQMHTELVAELLEDLTNDQLTS